MPDNKTAASMRNLTQIQSADAGALERYYDDWAASYDSDLAELGYEAPAQAAALLRAHGVLDDGRVLDACCGTGLAGRALREAGFDGLVGFDISADSLDAATASGVYERVFRQDMNAPLELPDDTFDAVVCIGSMTYAAEPGRFLSELCRVGVPGGVVLFTQRTDYWTDDFAGILDRLHTENIWRPAEITEPQPYLPGHPDFADRIGIVYGLFRVY